MKAFITIPMTLGATADADPAPGGVIVPAGNIAIFPGQMSGDGEPNRLALWLLGATTGGVTIQPWVLDEASLIHNGGQSLSEQLAKPAATLKWLKHGSVIVVVQSTVVLSAQLPLAGPVYFQKTTGDLVGADKLSVSRSRI